MNRVLNLELVSNRLRNLEISNVKQNLFNYLIERKRTKKKGRKKFLI